MKLCIIGIAMLAGCNGSMSRDEVEVSSRALVPSDCDPWACGTNSAHLGNVKFHELNLFHKPNAEGVVLDFVTLNGQEVTLEVHRDQPVARRSDNTLVSGSALVGLEMHLHVQQEQRYTLRMVDYVPTRYWIDPGRRVVPAFGFVAYPADGKGNREQLCSDVDDEPGWDTIRGKAILFTGDRYDKNAKTVSLTDTDGWFNIGCSATAVAKMHLNRHTAASTDTTHVTTWAERQTLLKLIVADYCGTGVAYTIDGTPLRWTMNQPWPVWQVPFAPAALASNDAIWDENGALCIGVPRLAANGDTGIDAAIVDGCAAAGHPLPPCPGSVGAAAASYVSPVGGYALSANPGP